MRRKSGIVTHGREKSVMYTCALLGLSVYAVPKLPPLSHGLPGTFTALWILTVAVAVAANLYFACGADKERKQLLEEQSVQSAVFGTSRERVSERQ